MAEQIPSQQGRIVVVTVADPGAGVDWAFNLPIRVRWHLKRVQCKLTTGVDVAERVPELTITQGGVEVIRITASQSLAASLVFLYGWHEGERALAVTGQTSRVTALPRGLHLNDQAVIQVVTAGLTMTDDWTNIYIMAEEWIEPLA